MSPHGSTQALWWLSANAPALRETALPEAHKANRCVVLSSHSSVSPGTERLVGAGRVPPALHGAMACPHMEGSFDFPIKYGYSLVGEVVEGPAPWLGRRVHLLHPHQARAVVDVSALSEVPPYVPAARATLASNLETALNAVWDAGAALGDRCLVVGFGVVGALLARLLTRIEGTDVSVVEPHADRMALARKLGFAVDAQAPTDGEFDLAFHTSGQAQGAALALRSLGFEGTLVELSWYGDQQVCLPLGEGFHHKRQRIISSQVSHVAAGRRARWDHSRRKRLVFELLRDSFYDGLLSEPLSLTEAVDWFAGKRPLSRGLAPLITYESKEV